MTWSCGSRSTVREAARFLRRGHMAIVFRGRVFSVEVGEQRFPNGTTHKVEIVRHAPSVVVIPVESKDRVVLIRQYRAPLDRETWEFPAGSIDAGEAAHEAARRECEEEIGRVPQVVDRLCALYPTPGFCDEELIFFYASGLHKPAADSKHAPDEDEDIQTRVIEINDARRMVARGEIVDLKTAYALTLL
jgi:ADP-ribose pyrophosphatase